MSRPVDVDDFHHDSFVVVIFIEVHEADEVDHVCKKVKRAQESKGKTMPPPKIFVHEVRSANSPSPSMLMRPPPCDMQLIRHELQPTDLSMHSEVNIMPTDLFKSDSIHLSVTGRRMDNPPFKNKRLRFNRQASVVGMNETKVDDIATDIIIPRERVVSICNMEKDALDDYLNEGGDTQEQETELLQYFQVAHSNQAHKAHADAAAAAKPTAIEHSSSHATNACPLLENYQLHQGGAGNVGTRPTVVASTISVSIGKYYSK